MFGKSGPSLEIRSYLIVWDHTVRQLMRCYVLISDDFQLLKQKSEQQEVEISELRSTLKEKEGILLVFYNYNLNYSITKVVIRMRIL